MIENPPTLGNSMPADELLLNLESEPFGNAVNKINDDYLYWSDVKYRAQLLGIGKENLWEIVKYTRKKTDVAINGFDGIHFSLTNSMQRLCHEFDMNFGGSWGGGKDFSSGQEFARAVLDKFYHGRGDSVEPNGGCCHYPQSGQGNAA